MDTTNQGGSFVGGGVTGASSVPAPIDLRATLPISNLDNGEPMGMVPDFLGIAAQVMTNPENNVAPVDDNFAQRNMASVATGGQFVAQPAQPDQYGVGQQSDFQNSAGVDYSLGMLDNNEDDEKSEEEDDEDNQPISVKEDMDALFSGSELTEEFKSKVSTIFEASIAKKLTEEKARIRKQLTEELTAQLGEEAETQIQEVIRERDEKLGGMVDNYLTYCAEHWLAENKIAVEHGLRSEITSGFIKGLRSLFMEHNFEIPENQINVVEEMTGKISSLEQKLSEAVVANGGMREQLTNMKKQQVIESVGARLTLPQRDKLAQMAENINFSDIDDFKSKVTMLSEGYFKEPELVKTRPVEIVESVAMPTIPTQAKAIVDPTVDMYAKSLSGIVRH